MALKGGETSLNSVKAEDGIRRADRKPCLRHSLRQKRVAKWARMGGRFSWVWRVFCQAPAGEPGFRRPIYIGWTRCRHGAESVN